MALGQARTPAIARAAARVTAAKRWKNAELLAEAEIELELAWEEAAKQGIFRHGVRKPKVYCPTPGCDHRLDYYVPAARFCPYCGIPVDVAKIMAKAVETAKATETTNAEVHQ